MLENDVYVKTDAGREEIRSRSRGLPMAARAILLMVDGQRDVASMRALIAGSKAPSDVLDVLLSEGLIGTRDSAPRPAEALAVTPPVQSPAPSAARPVAAVPAVVAPPPQRPSPLPAPSTGAVSYDGPIDLLLPTIYGPEAATAPAPLVKRPVAMPPVALPPVPTPPAVAPPVVPQAPPSTDGAGSADRYNRLYAMMNEVVRDFLAPHRRYFFQLKIERCSTAADLTELLHDLQTTLAKAKGDAFASDVIARLRSATA